MREGIVINSSLCPSQSLSQLGPRILVLGCPGSGKSTFARHLAALIDLPLYYLDMLWHKPDKTTICREKFDVLLEKLLSRPKWIIDGNYQRTLPQRLAAATGVFLFDLDVSVCLAGIEQRIGKPRPDLPWTESGIDPDFREYAVNFRREKLPVILRLLQSAHCRTVIFKSCGMADRYLSRLESRIL